MKTRKQFGFALLEVLLAVLVFAIATYGVIVFSSRYVKSSEINSVEHEAALISSNYLPYLDTTVTSDGQNVNDDPIQGKQFNVNFLQSIGLADNDIDSAKGYVKTHLPLPDGSTSEMGGVRSNVTITDSSSQYMQNQSVLILGFKATAAQINALLSDEKNTFAIYYGTTVPFGDATLATQFIDSNKDKNTIYNVYLLYPSVVDTSKVTFDANGASFTPP